jgi:hypothetical protein
MTLRAVWNAYTVLTMSHRLLNIIKDSKDSWLTLCNTLNPIRTSTFLNDVSNNTIEIVCSLAGYSSPPSPCIGDSNIPQTAVDTIHDAASSLLAWQILGFFTSNDQVSALCYNFPSYSGNIEGLHLGSGIVQSTICPYSKQALPSITTLHQQWAGFLTTIFTAQLWALSDSAEFQKFICKDYKIGRLANFKDSELEKTIIDGVGVAAHIIAYCQAAKVDD